MTTKKSNTKRKSRARKKSPAQKLGEQEHTLIAKQKAQKKALDQRHKQQLKEFRHKAAILKRHNIAFVKENVKSLDKTNYRSRLINSFKDTGIFDNKARVQKVGNDEARILKERGYKVKNNRIILPKSEKENQRIVKVKNQKTRVVEGYNYDEGHYQRDIVDFQSWEEYLNDLRDKWDYFEGNGHQLAFRLYGNLSRETFMDVDALIRKLNEYGDRKPNFAKHVMEDWRETIQHIEVYKTTIPTWVKQDEARRKRQEQSRKRKTIRTYKMRQSKILSTQGRDVYELTVKRESAARANRRKKSKNNLT